jgi:hypothetical protein
MKTHYKNKILYIIFFLLLSMSLSSQVPEKFNYQAVIRGNTGELVTNANISLNISILQGGASGVAVFEESHTVVSNANGLVTLEIGGGTVVSGVFDHIDWANGPYFIEIEILPGDGITSSITSVSQLLSVPFSMHAKTAENVENIVYTETDPLFTAWDKSTGISISESQISDLNHFENSDEMDPVYAVSVASGITTADTFKWNNPEVLSEVDPYFTAWDKSSGILITEAQVSDLTHFTTADETDPIYAAWDKSTGITITESQISDLEHFTTADETDPVFTAWDRSTGISITESQVTDLTHFTTADETDPVFTAWDRATGISITESQIIDLNHFTTADETDPLFAAWDRTLGITITESQITDLDHFTTADEVDPLFSAAVASGITGIDTAYWNNKVDAETDPLFASWDRSTGISITESQISDLDHFTTADETDPLFTVAVASGITSIDTAYWNDKVDAETDPLYTAWDRSTGISITESQITDLDHFTTSDEADPIYSVSVASGITTTDTANWNAASEKHYVGELFQGGIVFYVENDGQNGLIASLADLDGGTGFIWSDVFTAPSSAEATFYNGALNTTQIVAQAGHDSSAADLCTNYSAGGYTDWYLPSSREILLLSQAAWSIYFILDADGDAGTYGLKISNINPFGNYWTSTGQGNNEAYMFDFRENSLQVVNKANQYRVRAIRAF